MLVSVFDFWYRSSRRRKIAKPLRLATFFRSLIFRRYTVLGRPLVRQTLAARCKLALNRDAAGVKWFILGDRSDAKNIAQNAAMSVYFVKLAFITLVRGCSLLLSIVGILFPAINVAL